MQWNGSKSAASRKIVEQVASVTSVTVLHPEVRHVWRHVWRNPDWACLKQQVATPESEPKRDPFIDAWMEFELFAR